MRDDLRALSDNLRRLRTARGFKQTELAERVGLSRIGYRNIEVGESEPRPDTLRAIATALGVAPSDLFVETRALQEVRFRARKKMQSRDEVLAFVGRKVEEYAGLEELLGKSLSIDLHALESRVGRSRGIERGRKAAALVREAFELGEQELVRDPCGLLEDRGIKVLTPVVASDDFFGLSVGPRDLGPAVVVNTWERISVERWIFTAFHELGHLVLHLSGYDVNEAAENADEENEADAFAGFFLMPERLFRAECEQARGLSWYDQVFKLKRIFRVSYRSIIHRMFFHLEKDERGRMYARFFAEYTRRTGKHLTAKTEPEGLGDDAFFGRPADRSAEEPERLDRHDFMQDRLARLVREALEKDRITLSKAACWRASRSAEKRAARRREAGATALGVIRAWPVSWGAEPLDVPWRWPPTRAFGSSLPRS